LLLPQSTPPETTPEPSALQEVATLSLQSGWPLAQACALQLATSPSTRQNKPVAQRSDSVLTPFSSHFQTTPSLQVEVFGTHAPAAQAPLEQVCVDRQVCVIVSLKPELSHCLTLEPSQRFAPGMQLMLPPTPTGPPAPSLPPAPTGPAPPKLPFGTPPSLFVPLQAASSMPNPMIAPTPRPILLRMTLLQSKDTR
jgi:hypothetical protein